MCKNGENGFTLLELVIALAIVGVLLIPALALFTGATFSTFRGGQETSGITKAQERMEELKYMGYTFIEEKLMAGEDRVVLNDTEGSFERVVTLERMRIVAGYGNEAFSLRPAGDEDTFLASVIFIEVGIAWMEGEKERFVSVSSYLSQR
jgi:prepilin-type N-terminal cleavage/methylation domain-containing protein